MNAEIQSNSVRPAIHGRYDDLLTERNKKLKAALSVGFPSGWCRDMIASEVMRKMKGNHEHI